MKKFTICFIFLAMVSIPIMAQEEIQLPPEVLFNRGKALMYEGKLSEALALLKKANEAKPDDLEITLHIARLYSWTKKWDDAIQLYRNVSRKSPADTEIHWQAKFGIAQVTSWQQKFDPAIKLYEEILQGYRGIGKFMKRDILLAIGDIISWKREFQAAIKYYNQMLESFPGDVVVYNRIARVNFWDENYPRAKEYAQKTLGLDKTNIYAKELIQTIDKIKKFSITAGYLYTFYTSTNAAGDFVQNHLSQVSFSWQIIEPLTMYLSVDVPVQNSIETVDPAIRSAWNADINTRIALAWRINRTMYLSWGFDYTFIAKIIPDLNTDLNYSVKLGDRFDLTVGYKFTWDHLDTHQVIKDRYYHQLSPGFIFYITKDIFTRFKVDLVTDFNDFSFSILIHQSFTIDPKNILQIYAFYGSGRSYSYFSNATLPRDSNNFAASVVYTHYLVPTVGIEGVVSYTNYIGVYQNVAVGIKGIFKF